MSRSIVIALAVLAIATSSARAATNYWDNNAADPGFGTANGTWGLEDRWTADPTGAVIPLVAETTTADDLHFGTASNGLRYGTITVSGTNQGFRTMTFGAASEPIMFSGGTLNLAATGSRIYANNYSNRIDSVLAGDGGLNCFGTLAYAAFLTTNATVVFPNSLLTDYRGVRGAMGGASVGLGGGGASRQCDAYHLRHNGSNITYQLQQNSDTPWTKCVKVELTQVGADVAGRVLYAKYINNGGLLGIDFDTTSNATDNAIATSFAEGGYGAAETVLTTEVRYPGFLTPTGTTIVHNASLVDFKAVDGTMAGGYISAHEAPAQAYFFTNNGSTATYQLQCEDGGYTKCVKIEMTQDGPDISARALYAKYTAIGNLGFDFDAGGNNGTIATSHTAPGYGVLKTELSGSHLPAVLELTAASTYSGDTALGLGCTLMLSGAGQLGSGSYAGTILNSGTLHCDSAAQQDLSGPIMGLGDLIKGREADYASLHHPAFLTPGMQTIFTNATLADYHGAGAVMGGAAIFNSRPLPGDAYFFTNDGATATFQLQTLDGQWTKCVKVELTQESTNIAARAVYAKYINNGSVLGFDFDAGGNGNTVATSYQAGGYGVAELTLTAHPNSKLTLTAANSYQRGTQIHAGVLEAKGSASALPPGDVITVDAGGELRLNVPGRPFNEAGGVGYNGPIMVNGGTLSLVSLFNAGHGRPITIDGGTLRSFSWEGQVAGPVGDNGNYMNSLTLRNGAQVTGHPIRVGNFTAAFIWVGGTNASSLAAGIRMVRSGTQPLTLDVADVTTNANADLTVSGVIWDFAGHEGMPVRKTGAGTVVFSATNTYIGDTAVSAGTLVLGADNTLNTNNNVVLDGGTLDMGAFNNSVGTLTLGTNSLINLGPGQLAFAGSSSNAWNGTLTLTGTLGPQTLRFGTNSMGLTGGQLQSIDVDGKSPGIDGEGYLTLGSGTVLLVR
jgi:autotransporter-associated beta strand protein